MKSSLRQQTLSLAVLYFSRIPIAAAADECQPWTWTWDLPRAALAAATPAPDARVNVLVRPTVKTNPRKDIVPQPGDINCRSWGQTYDDVGYWSCNQLAQEFAITIDRFWELNPQLAPDCDGIAPNTEYCVSGCKSRSLDSNTTFDVVWMYLTIRRLIERRRLYL